MKRIGISQRLDAIWGRGENRDALDVRWGELLWSLGYLPVPLCSGVAEPSSYIQQLELDGFILSGGNDIGRAHDRDLLERAVLDYSRARNLPVLGICRGMQMMHVYLGGSMVDVKGHVATRHEISGLWAEESGYREVNSYHNQAISPEVDPSIFIVLSKAPDGVIEAIQHQSLPWLGIMWHPEREAPYSENDTQLILRHFG